MTTKKTTDQKDPANAKGVNRPNTGIDTSVDKNPKVKDNDKKIDVDPSDDKDGGYTDQRHNNAPSDGSAIVPGTLPKRANQHIRNTKEAGRVARDHGQEPNVSDEEANAGYRYVEPAFPPSDEDKKI